MKFVVVILAFVAAASAQVPFKTYNPFAIPTVTRARTPFSAIPTVTGVRTPFSASTPAPAHRLSPIHTSVPIARVQSGDQYAETLKYGNDNAPDGSYAYFYETSNGIAAQEQGTPRVFGGNPPVAPIVAQGSFSWRSPEGQPIVISYIADENGYQPSGDAIPTPPPVPAQIARALAYVANYAPQK